MSYVPVFLRDLMTPPTESEVIDISIETFKGNGFDVTSWKSGGIGRGITSLITKLFLKQSIYVSLLARGGYLDTATGKWLTILAKGWFQENRRAATYAVHTVKLTNSGSTPYDIAVGQVWITTPDGKRFNNIQSGTLPAVGYSGFLDLRFRAESPGADYNVSSNTINRMVTSDLLGVSCTNPYTTLYNQGQNEQSDTELRQVCRLKWNLLTSTLPRDAYEYIARTASGSVNRVFVNANAPGGPNTMWVYIAGPDGPVSDNVLGVVDTALQKKRAIGAVVKTLSAPQATITPDGTIYYSGVSQSAVQAGVEAALDALLAATPIGGTEINGEHAIYVDSIYEAIRSVPGIRRVSLNSGDHNIYPYEVPAGIYTELTYVAV